MKRQAEGRTRRWAVFEEQQEKGGVGRNSNRREKQWLKEAAVASAVEEGVCKSTGSG